MTDTVTPGITRLRNIANWADWQDENWWLPFAGRNPTLEQIVQLYDLCMAWGIETPADLAHHKDDRARRAFQNWDAARGTK